MTAPLTMTERAIALHEMFTSLLAAGFTRPEALYLVSAIARGSGGAPTISR